MPVVHAPLSLVIAKAKRELIRLIPDFGWYVEAWWPGVISITCRRWLLSLSISSASTLSHHYGVRSVD